MIFTPLNYKLPADSTKVMKEVLPNNQMTNVEQKNNNKIIDKKSSKVSFTIDSILGHKETPMTVSNSTTAPYRSMAGSLPDLVNTEGSIQAYMERFGGQSPSPAHQYVGSPWSYQFLPYVTAPVLSTGFRHFHTAVNCPVSINCSISPNLHSLSDDRGGRSYQESGGRVKRVRTVFTQRQIERLEREFSKQHYMIGPERYCLARQLNLNESQVKVWFQNRRIKWRKQQPQQRNLTQSSSSSLMSKLDVIRYNTDQKIKRQLTEEFYQIDGFMFGQKSSLE